MLEVGDGPGAAKRIDGVGRSRLRWETGCTRQNGGSIEPHTLAEVGTRATYRLEGPAGGRMA
jgi:hypothetical protein